MEDQPDKQDKKPYEPPKLTRYGRIERLTTGGSGPEIEMSTFDDMGMLVMDMAKNRAFP